MYINDQITKVGVLASDAIVLEENKQDFVRVMRNNGINCMLRHAPKDSKFDYRGHEILVPCTSAMDRYSFAVEVEIRGSAVDNGALVALWAENELVCERRVPPQSMDAGVVRQAAAARKLLLD